MPMLLEVVLFVARNHLKILEKVLQVLRRLKVACSIGGL